MLQAERGKVSADVVSSRSADNVVNLSLAVTTGIPAMRECRREIGKDAF